MNRNLRRAAFVLAAATLVALSAMRGAFAQTPGDTEAEDQIVLTGSLVVPAGETVGTAVILHGDARIEGTVTETLVVIDGDTEITGSVGQDVVSFNGAVVVRSGAEIGSDIISRRTPVVEDGATVGGEIQGIARGLDLGDWELAGRIFWWVGYSVSTLVLGLVLLRLAKGLDVASTRALERRTLGTFGFGALVFFLLPVVAGLLFVSVLALPLGLFLLLALALLYTIAYVVGIIALGRQVVKAPTSRYLAFLAAWGAFRVAELVPYVGGVAWIAAALIGFGTLWLAGRSTPSTPEAEGSVVPPPPAPTTA